MSNKVLAFILILSSCALNGQQVAPMLSRPATTSGNAAATVARSLNTTNQLPAPLQTFLIAGQPPVSGIPPSLEVVKSALTWFLEDPIAPYLFGLAVGGIAFLSIFLLDESRPHLLDCWGIGSNSAAITKTALWLGGAHCTHAQYYTYLCRAAILGNENALSVLIADAQRNGYRLADEEAIEWLCCAAENKKDNPATLSCVLAQCDKIFINIPRFSSSKTPLCCAIGAGNEACAQTLIAAGAVASKVQLINRETGEILVVCPTSPLHVACVRLQENLYLFAQAVREKKEHLDLMALKNSVEKFVRIIGLLLRAGANPNELDAADQRPADLVDHSLIKTYLDYTVPKHRPRINRWLSILGSSGNASPQNL